MAQRTIEREVETKTRVTVKLTAKDIIALLQKAYPDEQLMGDVRVTFVVPRGADWSGMAIDVDKDNPVVVIYETVTTTHEPKE